MQNLSIVIKCQKPSHHQISVEAAVLNGFADVFGSNIIASGHLANLARQLVGGGR